MQYLYFMFIYYMSIICRSASDTRTTLDEFSVA